jgi:epoxide hydrolase 4
MKNLVSALWLLVFTPIILMFASVQVRAENSIDEQSVTLENGQTIHYYAKGDPKAPLIMFLHGFPEFGLAWKDQLEEFGKDHFAVAPDLRGYNLSSKPKEISDYQVPKVAEDIYQLLSKLNKKSMVLVGHDWGGPVAFVFAMTHPEVLTGLVSVNGPHPFVYAATFNDPASGQRKASQYMDDIRAGKISAEGLTADNFKVLKDIVIKPAGLDEATQAEYEKAWGQPGAIDSGLNYYRAMDYPIAPPPADLAPGVIRTKTLVIWGMKDPYIVQANVDSPLLKQLVPNLTIRKVPNADHWVNHEASKDVSNYIREFISTL